MVDMPVIAVNVDLNTTTTREIFNLTGREKIALDQNNMGHTSLQTLKDWVKKDLARELGVTNINNTLDVNKPLSKVQKLYVDGSVNNLSNAINNLYNYIALLETKISVLDSEVVALRSMQ